MKGTAESPLRVAASTRGLVLDTIVTGNPERRGQAAAAYPQARLSDSTSGLWPRVGELDLLIVASPNRTHVPLATEALQAGLSVVVDKPLAATAAEARKLASLAEARGRLLSVFQNRRWDGDLLTVRRAIAEGELGQVHRFEFRFERWRPQLRGGWKDSPDPAEMGGTLYDPGSHLVDQALEPEARWGRIDDSAAPLPGAGRSVPTLPGDDAAVAAALRDGTPPPVTAHEAAAALEILEAARTSSRESRTVVLPRADDARG